MKSNVQILTRKLQQCPLLGLTFLQFGSYGRRISVMGRKELELLPADLITAVVTDLRILPPSAAPAVLKAKDLEAE